MTIYLDSRYSDGPLFKAKNPNTLNTVVTVFRTFPEYLVSFSLYEVTEIDRIENIAVKFLGNPELWWQIMDINPEILNPFEIPPGTLLRIPNE
jgi:nucleoid-associated protein YgaU